MSATPESLPQKRVDPYAAVDVRDFSTAGTMTEDQIRTMADLAQQRGDVDSAQRWKHVHVEFQIEQQRQADTRRMQDILNQPAPVRHEGPIVDPKGTEPWSNDPEYLRLSGQIEDVERVMSRLETWEHGFSDHAVSLSNLQQDRIDRQQELIEAAAAAGLWTEQDARRVAAQDSLQSKAGDLAAMLRGQQP